MRIIKNQNNCILVILKTLKIKIMKHHQKMLLLVMLSFTMLSFTVVEKSTHKIKIVDSSEQLNASEFVLKEGKTELKKGIDYTFYVEIKSKAINGKKVNKDYTKTKRKGIEYKVTYIYEYASGANKKQKFKQTYIVWEDGTVSKLKKPERINVGKMTLKTEIE